MDNNTIKTAKTDMIDRFNPGMKPDDLDNLGRLAGNEKPNPDYVRPSEPDHVHFPEPIPPREPKHIDPIDTNVEATGKIDPRNPGRVTPPNLQPEAGGEIFNPANIYAEYQRDEALAQKYVRDAVCAGTIKNCIMGSDGKLYDDKSTGRNIYIYKVTADTAGVLIENFDELNFNPKNDKSNNDRLSIAFYDPDVNKCLTAELDDTAKDIDNLSNFQKEIFKYYCHSIGAKRSREVTAAKGTGKSYRVDVPREIIRDINEAFYLFVCAKPQKGRPRVKSYHLPLDVPVFWDLPIATSVHYGEPLGKSKILLGKVVVLSTELELSNIMRGTKEEIPPFERLPKDYITKKANVRLKNETWDGQYRWNNDSKTVTGGDAVCTVHHSNEQGYGYSFLYGGKFYSCPATLTLKAYKDREKEVNAFVWRSGNKDDAFTWFTSNEGAKNVFPHLLESLSLGAIYSSYVSMRKISAEAAARYVVRTVALQPPGYRSVSIEGHLELLMGGMLRYIENKLKELKEIKKQYDASGLKEQEIVIYIRSFPSLFTMNGSYLFYDSAVSYRTETVTYSDLVELTSSTVPQTLKYAVWYMEQGLGISEGSNGCERMRELMRGVFREIKKTGLEIDYVFCDIEHVHADANSISKNRFNETFQMVHGFDTTEEMRKKIYDGNIWNEIRNRPEIWEALAGRGYYISEPPLEEIYNPKDEPYDRKARYGIRQDTSYAKRRNINVWDAVMKSHINDLFYEYVLKPVLDESPNTRCSAYVSAKNAGYINWARRFETYLGGSVCLNEDLHSCFSTYGNNYVEGYKKLTMDNWRMYPNEPTMFSYFMSFINRVRSTLLSSEKRPHYFVSSSKEWVKDVLTNKTSKLYRKFDDNNKEYTESVIMEYHKELLFHVFLSCPDAVAAYVNFDSEIQNLYSKGHITDEASTVITSKTASDEEKEAAFYRVCYEELNTIVKEVNSYMGGIRKPLTKKLAIETDPFVITGAQVNNENVWRITFDLEKGRPEVESIENGRVFRLGGRTVVFSEEIKQTRLRPVLPLLPKNRLLSLGYWVKTPANVFPVVSGDESFYESNAVYSICSDETERVKAELKDIKDSDAKTYSDADKYTVFGEAPQTQSFLLRFKVKDALKSNGEYKIFRMGAFGSSGLLYTKDGLSVIPSNEKPIPIAKDDEVEVRLIVRLKEAVRMEKKTINYDFEYRITYSSGNQRLTKILKPSKVEPYTREKTQEFFAQTVNLFSNYSECGLEFKEFKVFFTDSQIKVELFRESDGLNIGRVKRSVKEYENLPGRTKPGDKLIGKVSWLNATNEPITYRAKYSRDGVQYNFGINNVFPEDQSAWIGGVRATPNDTNEVFVKNGTFTVASNSEGYVLLDLLSKEKEDSCVCLCLCRIKTDIFPVPMDKKYFSENEGNEIEEISIIIEDV